MAQKWVDLSSATATDRILSVDNGAKHLSDGTLVFLDFDGTSYFLKYSSDHVTVNTIATLTGGATWTNGSLAVDSSDNIFVAAKTGSGAYKAQAFTKGAGYTWTAQTILTTAIASTSLDYLAMVWCNTGGGTGSHGHLMIIGNSLGVQGYLILDAGTLLAGSGTMMTASGNSPAFLGSQISGPTTGWNQDLDSDGFGATSGIAVGVNQTGAIAVGAWSVTSAGALSTNTLINTYSCGTLSSATKTRCIRVSSNLWAIVVPSSTAGRYMIGRWSSTAQLTALTDSGAPASMPLNAAALSWDALLDPVTASKVWVIATAAVSSGQQQVYRLGASVASGVTWDDTVTVDDLLTNTFASGADLRAVKTPRTNTADWQVFVQTASAPTYALDGDYTNFASAPSAPTLTSPINSATVDVSAAPPTFQSTFNSTDGANENAYALRQKVSGGSYNYWTGSAWQSTIIWPAVSVAPSGTTSVGPISTGLANGNTYNWSMASQEAIASLQGPFATDFVLTAQAGPTVTVTGPTGSVTSTNTPTATWTTTPAAGTSQTAYRVVVEHGSYGSVPGSGTQDFDSGTRAGSSQQLQIGTALANGTTYRVFVQVTETGGVLSTWAFQTFTVTLDVPQTPTVTAVAGTDPSTGEPRIAVTVQGGDNLLTTTQASLEDGTTTGWAAGASSSIANTTAQALDGTHALAITRLSTTGTASATTPTGTSGVVVVPGKTYQAIANFRAAATARSCTVQIQWWQASGAASSHPSDTSAAVNDTTSGWTQAFVSAVAPADAAFATVVPLIAAAVANEVHYVDEIDIGPGASAVWTRGGLVGSTVVVVTRSDGQVIRSTIGGATLPGAAANQALTVFDYEAQAGVSYTYSAVVSATLSPGASISSVAGVSGAVSLPAFTQAWLGQPTDTTKAQAVWIQKTDPIERPLAQGVFVGISQTTEAVVSDVYRKRHSGFTIVCTGDVQKNAILALLESGNVLSMKRPPSDPTQAGDYIYFIPIGSIIEDKLATVNRNAKERTLQFAYVEQARP